MEQWVEVDKSKRTPIKELQELWQDLQDKAAPCAKPPLKAGAGAGAKAKVGARAGLGVELGVRGRGRHALGIKRAHLALCNMHLA